MSDRRVTQLIAESLHKLKPFNPVVTQLIIEIAHRPGLYVYGIGMENPETNGIFTSLAQINHQVQNKLYVNGVRL